MIVNRRLAVQWAGYARPSGAAGRRRVPPAVILLKADEIYRTRAARGELPTIAPHDDWQLTLLLSNTELAHRLGRMKHWVVVYAQKVDGLEKRCSIVIETPGELTGRRVVRGREAECLSHYQHATAAVAPRIVSRQ